MILKLKDGDVKIEMFPDVAPNHVKRITELANSGKYDNVVFHRVIDGFMAQTGDVKFGNSESNDFDLRGIKHVKVIMARLEDQSESLKASIKSVPTVVLLDKNGKPKGQWAAGLNFKLNIEKEVIQNRINFLLFEDK